MAVGIQVGYHGTRMAPSSALPRKFLENRVGDSLFRVALPSPEILSFDPCRRRVRSSGDAVSQFTYVVVVCNGFVKTVNIIA